MKQQNIISLFNSFPKKGQPHYVSEHISITDFVNKIKYGSWKHLIEPIRAEKDKEKRNAMKRGLPAATVSGVFEERKEELLIEHSGFIQIDIDEYTNREKLQQDPYTYCLFNSVSGNGLCLFVKVNPDKHKESFKWLQDYYYKSYGIVVDPAPQNPASLRFVSYDPTLFINEKAKISRTLVSKFKKRQSIPIVLTGEKIADLVSEIASSGKDIAPDYQTYLHLSFALSTLGEEGREYFHAICQNSEKYNRDQAEKQFDIALKRNKTGISIGTFYWLAKENGFNVSNENNKFISSLAIAKKSGRTKEGASQQLQQLNGLDANTANLLVEEVFSRNDITINTATGDVENLIDSLINFMEMNHKIRKNAITGMVEENGVEVNRERLNTIYLRARMFFNSKDVTKDLIESIIFSDNTPTFNPITEFINKNSHLKSTGNIDALIASIKSPTPQKEMFIRKWLLGMIAAYDGVPVRYVLSLVGGQNTGKTEWFRRLLPKELKKYYAESKLDAGKDDEILMCQKLIVMDDEMGGKSKQDEKRFKELTSKAVFSLRAPYGRHNEDFKRLAILCGTSNDPEVINDPTGNTRILPVEVITIDHKKYNDIDKKELFMEIFRAYDNGESWQLNKEDLMQLELISSDFETTPYEHQLITRFFKYPESSLIGEWMTATDIKNHIETFTKQKIMSLKKLGIELRKIFGKPTAKKQNGNVNSCYFVQKIHEGQSSYNHLTTSETPENIDVPF